MRQITEDFIEFLQEYSIIGLAIAVVMGSATTDLVNATVEGLIMPIIEVVLPGEGWREATVMLGAAQIELGRLIGAAIDFTIIAVLVYLFVKLVFRKEDIEKIG